MGKLGSNARRAALVGACFVAGLVAVPGIAAARDAVQDTFITNTPANPVPVAPQGTTQVAGTVTVANPTSAPAAPIPVQASFSEQPITRAQPFAHGTLYEVPEGKVLTIEHFQAHWLFSGVGLRQASLRAASCFGDPADPNIDPLQVFFADQSAGLGYHVVGGPVTLHVPGGTCLQYEVGANFADIAEGTTLFMYGGITGYLTDAPVATP